MRMSMVFLGRRKGEGSWGKGPPPVSMFVGGRKKPFSDGCGLSSPGRWQPERRPERTEHWEKGHLLHDALMSLLSASLDVKKVVCKLAAGQYKQRPFDEHLLAKGRNLCAAVLDQHFNADRLLQVAPGQCFRLHLIGELLKAVNDPDWQVYTHAKINFASGVPLGYREPLPRTPALFNRKKKWKSYQDEELSWAVSGNYGDISSKEPQIRKQFEAEEKDDMMLRISRAEAEKEWQGRFKVASLGDIEKSDGSLPILHDGTHGVLVNPEVRQRDQTPTPGIGEEKVLQGDLASRATTAFGLKADVSKAHRRFKLLRKDWGLVACEIKPGELWLNKVGTFGMASSNYWFARLIGGPSRLIMTLLGRKVFWQLLYSDDFKWVAVGPTAVHELLFVFFVLALLDVPLSYEKLVEDSNSNGSDTPSTTRVLKQGFRRPGRGGYRSGCPGPLRKRRY